MADKKVTGCAKKIPWSGWWWPQSPNPPPMAAKNGPLDKFDQYIEKETNKNPGTVQWEMSHHHKPGCGWCGHCHGWSAASILECEPTMPQIFPHAGILFDVGHLKGLLTEVHCTDAGELLAGKRYLFTYKDDELDAHEFHQTLLDWVGNGEPVVMDVNKTYVVFNHPAYRFEMKSEPDLQDPNKTHVTCTVWFVNDGVTADFVGTQDFTKEYKYWITGDFNQPSDGGWEGSSQNDHPGFIWHPDYVDTKFPGNPLNPPNPVVQYYQSHLEWWARKQCPRLVGAVSDLAAIIPIGPIIPDKEPYGPINPLLFRGLVALDSFEGHARPAMATSWEVSEDGLAYVFHLRDGVTFHDGAPVTAEDVAFTYRTIMNPDLGSPHCDELTEIVAELEVVERQTIVFRLKRPLAGFPAMHGWHWILPQHLVEEGGLERFSFHPVGSGPFAFESREPGHYVALTAFSNYYLGRPRLDEIRFLEVPDADQRLNLLSQGSVDFAVFDYTLELEHRGQELPHIRAFAIPANRPSTLEFQSTRVLGRIPNEFDGAGNAHDWDLDVEAEGPAFAGPLRRLRRPMIRRARDVGANNPDARFPEWRPGAWWQIRVRQRAMAARVPDPGWTLPWHMLFEVMAEEAVEDIPCYHIRVTYPDRPSRAEHKSADVWVSKDTRVPVRGSLHIADRTIPMRHDFLMQVLKTAPMEVDTAGIPRTLPDPRWPQERVQLEAFETRTPDGGTRLSSMAAPFPLRIDEPDYIVELQDWSD